MAQKNDCERARLQISAFLDNELGSREAVLVTRHLEECVPCRHEYDRIREVRTTLRSLPAPTAAISGAAKQAAFARLEQATRQTPAQTTPSFWKALLSAGAIRPLAATLAMAAFAGMTFLLWPDADVTSSVQAGSVSAPTTAEWDNLFHRHDAQSLAFSTDDPALRRDIAAEAHASLLRQADEEVTGSL